MIVYLQKLKQGITQLLLVSNTSLGELTDRGSR